VEPIEVTVRDGLSVRSYLTLPQGQAAGDGEALPMIVLVHGGPHGPYDTWGFDTEAQLFASQGYAVLQVNYRGSGGRGVEFMAAGYGKWGAEMQDDITDTVRYTIAEGIADPERICIYGASYGGYAAMAGAYRDPDLYQCAVGYVGVYDLPMMFKKGDIPDREAGINFLKEALGTDSDDLRARSPSHNADRIKAATMLIHGKLDERAPYAHAVAMRKALTAAGNPPEWLIENREGHGFRDHDNRVALYTKLLDFFDEHIGD
jgi:dipeptidyl aminopeptidase/acylaminoacyl peptidase